MQNFLSYARFVVFDEMTTTNFKSKTADFEELDTAFLELDKEKYGKYSILPKYNLSNELKAWSYIRTVAEKQLKLYL